MAEEQTVNQIAAKYSVTPLVVSRWKKEFLERAPEIFKKGPSDAEKALALREEHIADLERKVGQLTYEVDWMKKICCNPRTRLGEKETLISPMSGLTAAFTGNHLNKKQSQNWTY